MNVKMATKARHHRESVCVCDEKNSLNGRQKTDGGGGKARNQDGKLKGTKRATAWQEKKRTKKGRKGEEGEDQGRMLHVNDSKKVGMHL